MSSSCTKDDADRLIENIPSDLDIFSFNREFAADPARAHTPLFYTAEDAGVTRISLSHPEGEE